MTTATAHRVPLVGPFDFAAVATMGFGHRDESSFDGVMRMAFCVDGDYVLQVGVEVRQDGDHLDVLIAEQPGAPPVDPDRVLAQVARVVSADHDGDAYAAVCQADPVLARVWSLAPGFRPALFYSPYEAAVWSILAARRARRQAIPIRERLANEYGATLPGIGPFYSALIVVRACGLADVLPDEPHVREAAERLYERSLTDAEFTELAEGWRPFRTWVSVLLRAIGSPVPADARADLTGARR